MKKLSLLFTLLLGLQFIALAQKGSVELTCLECESSDKVTCFDCTGTNSPLNAKGILVKDDNGERIIHSGFVWWMRGYQAYFMDWKNPTPYRINIRKTKYRTKSAFTTFVKECDCGVDQSQIMPDWANITNVPPIVSGLVPDGSEAYVIAGDTLGFVSTNIEGAIDTVLYPVHPPEPVYALRSTSVTIPSVKGFDSLEIHTHILTVDGVDLPPAITDTVSLTTVGLTGSKITIPDINGNDSATVETHELTYNGYSSGELISDTTLLCIDGKYLYVSENGDNTTAVKGDKCSPWRDPWAAKQAAVAGDLVYVLAGTYTSGGVGTGADVESDGTDLNATSILKDGVDYYFDAGAEIVIKNWRASDLRGVNLPVFFADGTSFLEAQVNGYGVFREEKANWQHEAESGNQFGVNDFATMVGKISNPNVRLIIEGDILEAGGFGFFITTSDEVTVDFRSAIKGGWSLFEFAGNLGTFNVANVSARFDDELDLVRQTYEGLEQRNFNRALIVNQGNNSNVFVNIDNIILTTGWVGILNSLRASENLNTSINIGVANIKDAVILNTPNTQATGTFNPGGNPTNGNSVTIGAMTYTFVTTLSGAANEVLIGANQNLTVEYLNYAIFGAAGQYGVTIGTGTAPNLDVTALFYAPFGTLSITAVEGGVVGNSIALSSTVGTVSGATLTGGADDNANSMSRDAGALLHRATNVDPTGSEVLNLDVKTLITNMPLIYLQYNNWPNHKAHIKVHNVISDSDKSLIKINTTGATVDASRSTEVEIEMNLTQKGEGPVYEFLGNGVHPASQVLFRLKGRYHSESTTSPIITNTWGDSDVRTTYLDNCVFVSDFTESITGTNPQTYGVMDVYSNKPASANITQLIDLIVVDPSVK